MDRGEGSVEKAFASEFDYKSKSKFKIRRAWLVRT
jgi:hypothetical protein